MHANTRKNAWMHRHVKVPPSQLAEECGFSGSQRQIRFYVWRRHGRLVSSLSPDGDNGPIMGYVPQMRQSIASQVFGGHRLHEVNCPPIPPDELVSKARMWAGKVKPVIDEDLIEGSKQPHLNMTNEQFHHKYLKRVGQLLRQIPGNFLFGLTATGQQFRATEPGQALGRNQFRMEICDVCTAPIPPHIARIQCPICGHNCHKDSLDIHCDGPGNEGCQWVPEGVCTRITGKAKIEFGQQVKSRPAHWASLRN